MMTALALAGIVIGIVTVVWVISWLISRWMFKGVFADASLMNKPADYNNRLFCISCNTHVGNDSDDKPPDTCLNCGTDLRDSNNLIYRWDERFHEGSQ